MKNSRTKDIIKKTKTQQKTTQEKSIQKNIPQYNTTYYTISNPKLAKTK